jgi:hypothetical protein
MNAAVSAQFECPPCTEHNGTTPQLISLDINRVGLDWVATVDPIVIGHPNIRVTWGLVDVINSINWGGRIVTKVEIRFCCGPGDYDPIQGPFITTTTCVPPMKTLEGNDQKPPYGDCYRYYLLVWLQGKNKPEEVFPIDPQIDNLAPPVTPYKGDDDSR